MRSVYSITAEPISSLFKFIADPNEGIINNVDCSFAGKDIK